jgi:hypothetical protein
MIRDCSKCGPTEAGFPKTGAVCSPCVAVYKRGYYQNHKKQINRKNLENYRQHYERYSAQRKAQYAAAPGAAKDRARASRAERKRIVNEAKSKPCMDCGHSFPPECMDFDHRPGEVKIGCVGTLRAWTAPIEMIIEEIAKCDLVCSNCHRIRTTKRRLEK